MRSLLRATIILKSLSCTLPESLLGMSTFILWNPLLWLLQKYKLTLLHSKSMSLSYKKPPISHFQTTMMMPLIRAIYPSVVCLLHIS
nr:hypothetical protein B456_004G278300 [Ipomoea batatas]GMD82731.1 hypothetical protein B456_004G278300 [Ipomoea batatas]GME06013.1 hypothetical protein B456_004G278300 [Ipomoea batatas]GME11505.1 hypothetical protein B456_004G278300 [Ipomoea batatas]